MSIKLTVYIDDFETFYSYWYGYGKIESVNLDEDTGKNRIVIDYGDDGYHARYQEGRFASGLIFAKIETN